MLRKRSREQRERVDRRAVGCGGSVIPLLLYAQAVDLVTFGFAAGALGIEGEYNPLAGFIYTHAGLVGVAAYKIGVVAAFAYLALSWKVFTRFLAITGIIIGTIGALTNVASLAVSV